jgi:thiaminase (transcriptional activator TenA)
MVSNDAGASFSAELWAAMAPTYDAILRHPFLTGLTDGSLDERAFAFYVVQDAHYLRDYARALAVVGAKAPSEGAIATFARHAAGAIEVERELHATLFGELGIPADAAASAEVAPTCRAYTSYLLATVYGGSFAEGVGAVLPCYWIYWEVGKALVAKGSPNPRYQRWIDTYAGEEFAGVVREVLAITDELGPRLSADERGRVRAHVVTTSRYEWLFWDMGHRREAWPEPLRG